MSFLIDSMLGVSITAIMIALILSLYGRCKMFVNTNSAKQTVLMRLAVGEAVGDSVLSSNPEVKSLIDGHFESPSYKVSRQEIIFSQVDLANLRKGLGKNQFLVISDASGTVITDDASKKGKGFLWLAEQEMQF